MIDTQFWILALIGTVACVLLALLVKRGMPPAEPPAVMDSPQRPDIRFSDAPRSHHIYGCKLADGQWRDVEELRNGMYDPANHDRVKFYLANGPDHGIRWHDGHVEPGSGPAPAAE